MKGGMMGGKLLYSGLLVAMDIFFIKNAYSNNDLGSLIFWSILLGVGSVLMIANICMYIEETIKGGRDDE